MESLSPEDKNGESVSYDDDDCLGYEDTDKCNGHCICHVVLVVMLRASLYLLPKINSMQILREKSTKVLTKHTCRQVTKEISAYCESE